MDGSRRPLRVIHFATTSVMLRSFILPLARFQRDQGMTVEFGCGEDLPPGYVSAIPELEAEGFPVHVVPFPYAVRPLRDLAALVRLWRFFRRERFDVVHTHNSKAGILARGAAWLAGCPCIAHTVTILHFRRYPAGFRRTAFAWAERMAARITDMVFCVGPVIRDEAVAAGVAAAERLRVIAGPVRELNRFHVEPNETVTLRAELGLAPDTPLVACVARLVDYKGVDTFLRAAKLVASRVPTVQFVVMGGGPLDSQLRAMAEQLGIADIVAFAGFRPDDRDILRLLATARVFCLPTRYDTYPIAFIEAMAMGCPAVGPRMNTVASIVLDGVTGLLVEEENEVAYAGAIERLLCDEPLRARLREAGLQRVKEDLDPRTMFEAVTASYSEPRVA